MNSTSENNLATAVVTTYNRPLLVRQAVQSVLNQTYNPLEVIVVEDGSDSGVQTWLQEKGLGHVTCLRHETNRGLAAARNSGLTASRGKYVAFLDDDDEWMPEKLEKQMALAEKLNEEWAVVYCGTLIRDENGKTVKQKLPRLQGSIKKAIVEKGLHTLPSTGLFRRDVLQLLNGFDTDLTTGIDHDIWMKLARHDYKADYVNEALVINQQHGSGTMTTDVSQRLPGIEQFINKWRPDILTWFGERAGRKYCAQYYVRVVGRLGLSVMARGDKRQGRHILWKAFIKGPGSFLSCPDLIRALLWGHSS